MPSAALRASCACPTSRTWTRRARRAKWPNRRARLSERRMAISCKSRSRSSWTILNARFHSRPVPSAPKRHCSRRRSHTFCSRARARSRRGCSTGLLSCSSRQGAWAMPRANSSFRRRQRSQRQGAQRVRRRSASACKATCPSCAGTASISCSRSSRKPGVGRRVCGRRRRWLRIGRAAATGRLLRSHAALELRVAQLRAV